MARWNFDPWLFAFMGSAGFAMLSARGGGAGGARWTLMVLLLLLYVSPLCALSSALFSVRVVHHVLLVALVAPLCVAAMPWGSARAYGGLPLWTGVHAVIFWLWHAPPAYEWALSGTFAYWLMQASLFFSAFLFWTGVRRAQPFAGVAALLATMVQMGLLGALLTFAATPFYRPHFAATPAWGLSPLEDQQLAGLIMWAPGSLIYLLAALLIAGRWLREKDAQTVRS